MVIECTPCDVQAGGLAGRLTCDRAGRQNGTHHRETQSALQTLVMEDDHQIAFNSQAIRVLLQHKDYDFIKQDGQQNIYNALKFVSVIKNL